MDDFELLRDLGRGLEHEPTASFARQRGRLLDAARAPGRRSPRRWTLFCAVAAAVTAAAILVPATLLHGGDARPVATDTTAPAAAGALNVLVIGSDSRRGGDLARSDTLMLAHVPADRKHVRVVSIPRDSLVTIPKCETAHGKVLPEHVGMINSAFASGGASCTLKTVESLTRVRIDKTVVIDFAGFTKMVDALGGVEMTLPKPVSDPKAGLDLPAGTQSLDGTQALAYVRSRYGLGDGSDLNRIGRQQKFMAALVREAEKEQRTNPVRFARFLAAAAGSVRTEPRLDIGTLEALASSFAKTGPGDVEFSTVPVHPAPADPNRLAWDRAAAERLFAPFRE
ncbi:LCP family protein [Spirillospora sp. NPDC048819]|uniref:LCP family protein n=1 Tax=Spirillospora sp. NPDC048819 TaxID=3155268 RepID=UPI0033DAF66F